MSEERLPAVELQVVPARLAMGYTNRGLTHSQIYEPSKTVQGFATAQSQKKYLDSDTTPSMFMHDPGKMLPRQQLPHAQRGVHLELCLSLTET